MPDAPDDRVVFDEIHVTFLVPRDLPRAAVTRARRVLDGKVFLARMRRSVATALRRHAALAPVTVVVSR